MGGDGAGGAAGGSCGCRGTKDGGLGVSLFPSV